MLFGCASDKDAKDIVSIFEGNVSNVVITKPNFSRAMDLSELEKLFNNAKINCVSCENSENAIQLLLKNYNKSSKNIILVTGSFYLVSDVVSYLKK